MKKSMIAIGAVLTIGLLTAGAGAATAATLSPSGTVHKTAAATADPNDPNDPTDPTDANESNEPKDANDPAEANETPDASDGNDGGHADTDGVDVQHTGDATEK